MISKMIYEKRVRVRVCGILVNENRILLLKHDGIGKDEFLWSPPGGGMEFGEMAEDTLKREFFEETHITVNVREFMFANEYLDGKYHAIELFFLVDYVSGDLILGKDPEVPDNEQILSEARYMNFPEINTLKFTQKHNIFQHCSTLEELFALKGFFNFKNI